MTIQVLFGDMKCNPTRCDITELNTKKKQDTWTKN